MQQKDCKMNVLVVDDSLTMLKILTNTLNRIGITSSDTATNGKEALKLFSKKDYDIVLTDWNMPLMNGLELVKEIRRINQDVHIVMITTEGGKREVITALKAGVNDYIIKPFPPQTLKEKLAHFL